MQARKLFYVLAASLLLSSCMLLPTSTPQPTTTPKPTLDAFGRLVPGKC